VSGEALAAIAEACRDARVLVFPYSSKGAPPAERRVEPYRLVHSSWRWYLLAFDLERGEWRTFRADRIEGIPKNAGSYRPRSLPAADVAAYVSESIASLRQRYAVRVTMHAAADAVRQRLKGWPVEVTPLDAASCELRTHGDSLEWICFSIGFLGIDFVVHEPPELVAEVRRIAKRFAAAAHEK
jgi:predicted DNA-binding transcriptional regulator YafY